MNKLLKLIVLACSLVSASISAGAELDSAILYGGLLTEAVKTGNTINIKKLKNFKSIKKYLSKNICPGLEYKSYVVGPEGEQYLYLVASNGKNVIIGRHFKAVYNNGKVDLETFESSTNSCLNLGTPPSNIAAMYATHLKPFPNEFHLLQSNLRSISLYIGTSTGMYAVENGTIGP